MEYLNKLIAIIKDFKLEKNPQTPEQQAKMLNEYYKQPEPKPLPEKDELVQKVNVDMSRFCIVCRSNSRNLFDIVMVKLKV